jgi:cell wall-associated NlpC family hydrolase
VTEARQQVVAAARRYIGVRWHHLGRTRHGVDCVGLILLAFRDAGFPLADVDPYARGHRGDELLDRVAQHGRRIGIDQIADGDLLVFSDEIYVAHIGIASTWQGQPAVVHAKAAHRKVHEEPLTFHMGATLRGAFRHPALEAQ